MSSQIPYCGSCRQKRDAEMEAKKAYKAERRKARGKGKGKAKGWGSGSESEDEEERVVRTLICREVMTQMRGARRLIGVA
jgi:hypothetical protein